MASSTWNYEMVEKLYCLPLLELISRAHQIHLEFHPLSEVQLCRLISIKTGGCPENCKYCSQSSYYQTGIQPMPQMRVEEVVAIAKQAKKEGVTRICLGAAVRGMRPGKQLDEILKMVRLIKEEGLEVCATLGMLREETARKLKEAGLFAYNHNLDTSENFYKEIVTTRTYEERIETLNVVAKEGLRICSGAIFGMGESVQDRLEFLITISKFQPESLPINRLSPIPGTPLETQPKISDLEIIRLIALARILLPKTVIRLSTARNGMSFESQALSFLAGANSLFVGEKYLTIANKSESDEEMFSLLGLKKREPYSCTQ